MQGAFIESSLIVQDSGLDEGEWLFQAGYAFTVTDVEVEKGFQTVSLEMIP